MKFKSLIFFLLSSLILSGCGGTSTDGSQNKGKEIREITFTELKDLFLKEEVTADNWSDYFKLELVPEYDSFDEETGETRYILVLNQDGIINTKDVAFKTHYDRTDTYTYVDPDSFEEVDPWNYKQEPNTQPTEKDIEFYPNNREVYVESGTYIGDSVNEDNGIKYKNKSVTTIDNFTVDKAKGYVIKCNIPDELWNTDEEGNRFIRVNCSEAPSNPLSIDHIDFYENNRVVSYKEDGTVVNDQKSSGLYTDEKLRLPEINYFYAIGSLYETVVNE